jgi:capsular polysaccharide biosynthesis protein
MDNSEVDLFQVMNIIWKKKKQILSITTIIVFSAVLFAYIQPKNYEAKLEAFVLSSEHSVFGSKNYLPLEYYQKFSKSPEVLNAVLETLPELKLEDNILPWDSLYSKLRVESKILNASQGLTTSTLKLIFYARHPDSYSAYKIVNAWQSVMKDKFPEFEKGVVLGKFYEVEEEFKLSKKKWDEAKNRLVEFSKDDHARNIRTEMNSIHRLITDAYKDIEDLEQEMDLDKILISKSEELLWIDDDHNKAKESLSEYRRLLSLQPQMILADKNHTRKPAQVEVTNTGNPRNNRVFNPAYTMLQEEIFTHEVQLKTLSSKKYRLEQEIKKLKSNANYQSQIVESPEFASKRNLIKNIRNTIKQYGVEYNRIASRMSKLQLEKAILTDQERSWARLLTSNFKKFEELKSLKTRNLRSLNFTFSALEPVIFLGTPMRRIIFISFGVGLIFAILITLIKENFGAQGMNEFYVKSNDSQYPGAFRDEKASNEIKVVEGKKTIPDSKVSESLEKSKPQYSPVSKDVAFAGDR